jgi:alpha-beta hydrolase superfamily lysophospholipase
VKAMRHVATMISSKITIYEIENAKHDIFLSKQSVRENAFNLMFQWLRYLEEDWLMMTKM